MWESWFGRSQWRDERPSRTQVPGWLAAVAVMAAFAGGFLVGDNVGAAKGAGASGLQAKARQEPTFLEHTEAEKLASNAFIVSLYAGVPEAEGLASAKALARFLQQQPGLAKARPYQAPVQGGKAWTVAVYYDGDKEFEATRQALRDLPEAVPDRSFVHLRNSDKLWPLAMAIQ